MYVNFLNGLILALSALSSLAVIAAESALEPYESKYYIIHTDLPQTEAREAQIRMTAMVDQYLQLNPSATAKKVSPQPDQHVRHRAPDNCQLSRQTAQMPAEPPENQARGGLTCLNKYSRYV